MSQRDIDLISMADIARVAGHSRATVGNWKSRNPEDFPPERGRGSRGPLYDRAEVIAWLEATNRLDKRPPEVAALWRIADLFRGELRTEDALPVLLVLLALLAKAPTGTWRRLRDALPADLDHAMRAAADELFPYAREVLPAQRLPAQAVAEAIATLSGSDRERVSVMADAVLEQAAKALGHRGGEFLSPPSVRKLIIAIAEPVGTVYNPATGVGQLMIDAATSDSSKSVNLIGQEINERIWAMSQLNLALHDVAAEVALGDVFAEDRYPRLRADRVISVPPWNQRFAMSDVLQDDPRWVWGEPGANDGNVAWMQHCLAHLADDGRAVIVLPNGALFEGGRAGRIRQRIIKAGLLDAVFALPPGLFAWTGLACAVLVLAKGRGDVAGKPASTLMVDLTASAEVASRGVTTLDDDLIKNAAFLYRRWTDGQQPVVAGYTAVATYDDLAANEFVIDPGRYLSLPSTATDLDAVTRDRAELVDRLASLTQASRAADKRLEALLGARR